MIQTKLSEHPYRVFGWAFATLLLLLILLEGWRYSGKPVAQNNVQLMGKTLNEVASEFSASQDKLLAQTQQLAGRLQSQLNRQQSRGQLFESMQASSNLWGTALYQRGQPLIWNNFSLDVFESQRPFDTLDSYVEVVKQNNVLLWIAHTGFRITTEGGSVPYHLFSTQRIEQVNALPIGDDRETSILPAPSSGQIYSVDIGIYDPPPPAYADYRTLRTQSGDSLGVVYATTNNLQEEHAQWRDGNRFWRAIFVLACFIIIGLLLYLRLETIPPGKALVFQIVVISIGWVVFNQINIAENWLPALLVNVRPDRIASYQMLCNFAVDSLFFLAVAFTLKKQLGKLRFRFRTTSFFSSIFAAVSGGLINLLALALTFNACYELAYNTAVPLLSLQIFPATGTILFYFGMGLMLWALTITLLVITQFMLRSCQEHSKLAIAICSTTFISGLFVLQLLIPDPLILNWAFTISVIYFGLVFLMAYSYSRYPRTVLNLSPLRTAAIYSILIAMAGSTIIYQAKTKTINLQLAQKVETFTQRTDLRAEELTGSILTELQNNFQSLTESDLLDRSSFIETQFTESVTSTIRDEAEAVYLYDLQLIDSELNLIADYSTNLNSPDWVNDFNLRGLRAGMEIEQISKNNVRPIIQQPELVDEENYQTFYRGWIPIFGADSYDPIAWILCSVYKERPDFNKPMRAVLASQYYQEWEESFIIQEYTDNRLSETVYLGVREYYPVYNILRTGEEKALQQDSTVYYSSAENDRTFRNLLHRQSDDRVVKATTMMPGYQNILFSFFRFSFTLFITGFIMLVLYQTVKTKKLTFFGDNKRFQYRILDSFLLATLLFLVLLIFATHFAIQQQNTDLVEEQLFEKLETITTAASNRPALQSQFNGGESALLDSLTASLKVDASFYADRLISKSTAPQIYDQHLLPAALPYPVYSDLFLSQKRDALTQVILGGQELLIGYRSILSNSDEPAGTIAIPTFVHSPTFNKQLLETTSYLIIIYLVVFGLFILGTFFISRQLTRPLEQIQQGLNKISKGDLDTTIPASGNDEIGSLAVAYNRMVSRLKQLQNELAEAEREAAWQEMAQQVAHEIKNPLTPMKLNIQHLERQLASGDYSVDELKQKIRKITQNLIVQIQSLNNIASDFSKFSKPLDEEFTTVNINELASSVAELYEHDDNKTLAVNCKAAPALVMGVEDELRRVLINLMKNAHEAMPEGGSISLETYNRQQHLFIKVEDSGKGINEEDKPKIFVPNFSTKSSGTGLGLAICKKIIEAHDGSISFASIKGEGTTFVIKLPQYQE